MVINSIEFLIFVFITVLIYRVCPKRIKWIILLLASGIFYITNSLYLIFSLLITSLIIYLTALKITTIQKNTKIEVKKITDKSKKNELKNKAKKKQKKVLALGIIINLLILIIFKYTGYINENINFILNKCNIKYNLPIFRFMLPLGISYYTLQAISYIVDVYRGKIEADRNFGKVLLFLLYFPQLIQGPIGRYDKLANQLYEPHKITYKNIVYGTQLMLWGYFKKMVIADRAAIYANEVFNNYTQYSGLAIIIAIIMYVIQIYTEFSGGIDIIRGVSQIFGITLEENFERPFFSKSIDEFWRRWNITLGAWLKEYVFYPVSLSKISMNITKKSKEFFKGNYLSKIVPIAFSLLAVWLCNGIWHGAGIKYIVYGLYYYTIMMLGKIFEPVGEFVLKIFKVNTKVFSYKLFQIIRTNVLVGIGMTLFRATSIKQAIIILKSVLKINRIDMIFSGEILKLGVLHTGDILIILFSIILLIIVGIFKERGIKLRHTFNSQNLLFRWGVLYSLIFIIVIFGIYGPGYDVSSFIYGQF